VAVAVHAGVVEMVHRQVHRRTPSRQNGGDQLGSQCGLSGGSEPVDRDPQRSTRLLGDQVVRDPGNDLGAWLSAHRVDH
jgi:hypothetical protein